MEKDEELDLLGNAIHSLEDGIQKYLSDGYNYEYKFVVLNIFQFLELFFKHYLAEEHELLIYVRPEKKDKTVTLHDCIERLKASGFTFKKEFLDNITWLTKTRNLFQHYKIEKYSRDDIKKLIGKILYFVFQFNDTNKQYPINIYDPKIKRCIESLKNGFLHDLDDAEKKVGHKTSYYCDNCGFDFVIEIWPKKSENHSDDWPYYQCQYCGTKHENSGCEICGETKEFGDHLCYYHQGKLGRDMSIYDE